MAIHINKKKTPDEKVSEEVKKRVDAKAEEAIEKSAPKEKKGPPKRAKKTEEYYCEKYPHFIPGSLQFDESANKQTAQIKCVECGNTERRVFTSDLFQVKTCMNCAKKKRQAKRDAAEAKKAEKEAAKVPAEEK